MSKKRNIFFSVGTVCILAAAVIFAKNLYEDYKVGIRTEEITKHIINEEKGKKLKEYDKDENSKIEMPTKKIGGKDYIGYLEIESINIKLPVMNFWSYENIRIAPARYKGSVYDDNMIILAHNFRSHFGNLHRLKIGDDVKFYDMDNNLFVYKVKNKEEIKGDNEEKLLSGKWDITLLTCTMDGRFRTVIRCEHKK